MTNNVNLGQISVAASGGGAPPRLPAEQTPPEMKDQVVLGQDPNPPSTQKLVVTMQVDAKLLQPDASGNAPISGLEPVFIPKAEVPSHDPSHVPTGVNGQFAPAGGDLLVVPVPPHQPNAKFIAVPIEVPNELLEPTGKTLPDGTPARGVDDFDARLVPHDAVIKKPSDYHNDLKEAYDGGKNDYLPQGYTRVVANSKGGQILEMTGGMVSKIGTVGSGFGNMVLAGWNSWMSLATAGTLAGIGGAIGVLGALDQMKKISNEKGRLEYLKQNYDAGEARQSLLNDAPEAGARYIEALKGKYEAEHVLLQPKSELKQYDDIVAQGEKKKEKGKLKEGEIAQLEALKKEREGVEAKVKALEARVAEAAQTVEAARGQLPPEKAEKLDKAVAALAPNLQHYEANRGDQMSLPQALSKALEAEGVGAIPMQTMRGIQNVPLEEQIKAQDTQLKVQGVSAVASGLGMACGIMATVGIGCPPLLAAAAVLLPLTGIVLMVGKPLAMLGKMLWNKWFNKDQTPTPERAVLGEKAKPEGPKEQAAWDKSMGIRAGMIKADPSNAEGYFKALHDLEQTRMAAMTAPNPEAAGKAQAENQKAALELKQFQDALDKSAPGQVAAFKQSLADLNDCWAERRADEALQQQGYKDILSAGVVTRSASNLGLTSAQTERVLTNLMLAEFGHQEAVATVQSWQGGSASQTPEARMAAVLIQTSKALEQSADPNKVVQVATNTPQQPPAAPTAPVAPAPAPDAQQQAAPADPAQARAQLEQQMVGLVTAAIQGNVQADQQLTALQQQASAGDPGAQEAFQIAQAVIGEIASNAKSVVDSASPELLSKSKAVSDALARGDQAAQQTLQGLMATAQANNEGSAAAQQQLQVIDALYLCQRLNIPVGTAEPAAAQQQAPQG
ncbi:hypothetical protein DYH09_22645 [bacterium CPR1]|nr:hypothetical protein [bacterium CPR1]